MKVNKVIFLAIVMLMVFSCNPTSKKSFLSKKEDKAPLIIHIRTANREISHRLNSTLLDESGLNPLVSFYYFPLLYVPSNKSILSDVEEDVPFNTWLEEKNTSKLFLPLYYTFNSNIKPLEISHSLSSIYFNLSCTNDDDSASIKIQPSPTETKRSSALLGSDDEKSIFSKKSSEHLKTLLIEKGRINAKLRAMGAETGTILSTNDCFSLILICALKKQAIDPEDNKLKDYIYFIPLNTSIASDFNL